MVFMKNNLCQSLASNRKLAHLIEPGRRYLNFLLHSYLWATEYDKKSTRYYEICSRQDPKLQCVRLLRNSINLSFCAIIKTTVLILFDKPQVSLFQIFPGF